jgi:hypothetical protein
MDSDVRTPRLLALGDDELVPVRRQIAEPVQGRSGAMGDDTLLWLAFPGKRLGCELKPCGAQLNVIGKRRSGQVVDPSRYPLEDLVFAAETLKGGARYAGAFGLLAG